MVRFRFTIIHINAPAVSIALMLILLYELDGKLAVILMGSDPCGPNPLTICTVFAPPITLGVFARVFAARTSAEDEHFIHKCQTSDQDGQNTEHTCAGMSRYPC